MNQLTISLAARRALMKGVDDGHPVSNLELLGLPPRVLGLLENSTYRIVTLKQLLSHSREDLLSIRSLGEKSLGQIFECLARYDQLEREYLEADPFAEAETAYDSPDYDSAEVGVNP